MSHNKFPEIRFKEFEYEWQKFHLIEIVTRKSAKSNDTNLKRIEYEDIISGIGVLNNEWHGKGDSRTGITFNKGDVLYGYLRPYLKNWYYAEFEGKAIGDFWVLDSLNNDGLFIYSLIQTSKFQELSNVSSGTKMPRADWKLISTSEFYVPSIKLEQQKIGNFFLKIDQTLFNKKKELMRLKDFKQAMLQKMFPKEGETVPEVRFEGFDAEWDSIKIKDIITKGGSGGTPTSTNSSYYNGHIPFLSISDITNSSGVVSKTIKSITKAGLNNSTAYIVPKDSVSLAMYASVGKVALLDVDLATSQAFYNMEFSNSELAEYVYVYLSKVESENGWDKLISTGTQANLNAEKVKNYELKIPKSDEMFLIKNYFIQFDKLIYIKQDELTKLKQFKQAMLDKMLV